MSGLTWVDSGTITFLSQNFDETIVEEVHADAQELVNLLYYRILDRTPVRTGALAASLDVEVNSDDFTSSDIMTWLFLDEPQVDEYGRVYAAYQEGEPLGLSTYTNPPHEMLNKLQTDDLPLIEAWFRGSVEQAVNKLAAGEGVQGDA